MAKFKPGNKANPKGRPKGSADWRTRVARTLQKDLPALLKVTKERALAGDTQAMRLLLERTLPARKAQADTVIIPQLAGAGTISEKCKAIMTAIGSGRLAPDVGAQLLDSLNQSARLADLDQIDKLERRMRALEEMEGPGDSP